VSDIKRIRASSSLSFFSLSLSLCACLSVSEDKEEEEEKAYTYTCNRERVLFQQQKMKDAEFDKLFNRKAAEYLNSKGEKEEEREVKIPEHMLPGEQQRRDGKEKEEDVLKKNNNDGEEKNEQEKQKTIPEQILEAYENQNYFKALAVAEPTSNDIGDPIWTVTAAELSKAFRRRSLLTHPDKNPDDEKAREAFDVLSECHQKLKNEETKREALNAFAKKAFEKMCLDDPELRARAMKAREKKEVGDFQEEIKRQREEGMEKRKRKEEMKMKSKNRRRNQEEDEDEEAKKMRALLEEGNEEEGEKKENDNDHDDDENALERVQSALLKSKKKKKSFLF